MSGHFQAVCAGAGAAALRKEGFSGSLGPVQKLDATRIWRKQMLSSGKESVIFMRKGRRSNGSICIGVNSALQEETARKLQNSDSFPIVRVYQNDLCTLELMGDAAAEEALAALASDGGRTAEAEMAAGKSLMTIDVTVNGRLDGGSTVSTRLMSPTKLVAERAREEREAGERKKSWEGGGRFRSCETVLMRQLLRFELRLRKPGHVRDVERLREEELPAVIRLGSLNGNVLHSLAEAVSSHAVAFAKERYRREASGRSGWEFLSGFWSRLKLKWSPGAEAAVRVRFLSAAEISAQTRRLWGGLPAGSGIVRASHAWWPLHSCIMPGKMQCDDPLVLEYVPLHMIEVDVDGLEVDLDGVQQSNDGGVVTLLLSHAQMVELANVLDCYYDDPYTVSGKKLVTHAELDVSFSSRTRLMLAATMSIVAAALGGAMLVGCLAAARLRSGNSSPMPSRPLLSRQYIATSNRKRLLPINDELPAKEMEVLCRVVVAMIKDTVGWPQQIESRAGDGAWMGKDLTLWTRPDLEGLSTTEEAPVQNSSAAGDKRSLGLDNTEFDSTRDKSIVEPGEEVASEARVSDADQPEVETASSPVDTDSSQGGEEGVKEQVLDPDKVLAYQVVLARDGQVIGFSPLNRPAVQNWAKFPLAESLYGGKKLRPGFFERVPKNRSPPDDAVVIELLYLDELSVTARPFHL